jgi:hypothetical protein
MGEFGGSREISSSNDLKHQTRKESIMKSKITTIFRIGFIMTAYLLTLSFFLSTRAFAEAELHVFESRIGDRGCGDTAISSGPRGYFNPTDPDLVSSESFAFPSTFGHDGCQDEEFQDRKIYQDLVRVNTQRKPCMLCGLWLASGTPAPHSEATASGFADAGRLILGAYSEARPDSGIVLPSLVTQGQAEADASFRNRVTVLPGNSGLPAGAPVRLRWFFRLHGTTDASGRTFPNHTATLADVNFDAKIVREVEVCQPDDGTVFCSRPTAAQFGLDARTEASDSDPTNPFTFGETGSISHNLNWSAHNNLGQQLGAPIRERAVFGLQDQDGFMSRSFPVDSDSLVSSLEFEATVGETLEIRADLFTLAIIGGGAGSSSGGTLGSTRNHFFGSFTNNIVDAENRGLQLTFEILPETLNNQPVANAGQDEVGSVGRVVTLDGSESADSDNNPSPLNFRWFQKGGPAAVTLTGDTTATPHFTPPLEGTYTFRLIVDDGEFDSGPDDVVITVATTGENQPPMAQCQNVTVPAALNSCVVASASIDNVSSDPDSDTLSLTQSPAGPYTLGNTEVTLTVSDGALSSQCIATVTVTDGQAPAITCPTDQTVTATSSDGAVVNFAPTATENCPTLMTSCSATSGAIFPIGTTAVTCMATDGGGLQNSCSFNVNVNYSTSYSFTGFFQPVDNVPTFNTVKAGQSVPIKFSLGGNYGLNILAAGAPTSQQIACPSSASVDDIEQVVTGSNSGLQYDTATGAYTYVWKTQKAWGGRCRQLNVRLSDGTDHTANFQFK